MKVKDILKQLDEYYFVGDDAHSYAFGYISKDLGKFLMKKYPNLVNNGGIRIESYRDFELSDIPDELDMKGLWNELLSYDDYFWEKGYRTYDDFIKGEDLEEYK